MIVNLNIHVFTDQSFAVSTDLTNQLNKM